MTEKDIKEQFLDMMERHIGIVVKISGAYAKIREDREDLMHDITLELWKSFKRFDGSCKISTWMYRIALNTSMNYKRKLNKSPIHTSMSDSGSKEIIPWLTQPDNVPELEILYSCIEELSEINKAITLLYLDGNSHEEISIIMGISKTNVSTRIGRIKEELKKTAISKI